MRPVVRQEFRPGLDDREFHRDPFNVGRRLLGAQRD